MAVGSRHNHINFCVCVRGDIFERGGWDISVSEQLDIFYQACLTNWPSMSMQHAKLVKWRARLWEGESEFVFADIFVIWMCQNKVCFCFCSVPPIRQVWSPCGGNRANWQHKCDNVWPDLRDELDVARPPLSKPSLAWKNRLISVVHCIIKKWRC